MSATHSSILFAEVPVYAALQREMHEALRAQHPEWIEAGGNSPTCDSYESRFAELLTVSLATERAHQQRKPYNHIHRGLYLARRGGGAVTFEINAPKEFV